ncbi:MAG: hypothetical protein H7Y32_20230 [Chloroflexales bacterium]|nr:hypothetical protein [Chloroflexales bacterium]
MAEPEQIGPFVFVPNADYPYPFEVELPPRFWMEETTGVLAQAVNAYIDGERLEPKQIELLRLYLQQYIERVVLAGDVNRKLLLAQLPKLRSARNIESFAEEIAEMGIEPF